METLVTALLFLLITGLSVTVYLRRQGRGKASPPAGSEPAPCPRCGASVPAQARLCPACGIPQQVFALVRAATVLAESSPGRSSGGAEHAIVRADLCVGCGSCVDVCPEPGAILLEGKLAIVDRARCRAHGECVKACPLGAIAIASGDAVQRVRVPDLSGAFESNVRGLYIVGELGGRGLIKNAVNEGKLAVESIARDLDGRPRGPGADPATFDVAIVGSGPAGLSAGLEAIRLGLNYVILEQGSLAESIRKYPRHKFLLAEPVRIPLYGDLWVGDASKEALLEVWETIIARNGLSVRTGRRVEDVVSGPEGFLLHTGQGDVRARRVVLAMGRRGTPRRLGVPGEDRENVFYDIVEMEAFRDRRVLVVGGGDSALESAVGLANQPGTRVHLSYRGTEFSRAKDRNRAKLEAATVSGKVALLLGSEVREIRPSEVLLEMNDRRIALPNDDVIVRVGGDPPYTFLERIGVRIVDKELRLEGVEAALA